MGFASSVYALDVGTMLFVRAGLDWILLSEEGKRGSPTLPPARLKRLRRSVMSLAIGGAVFSVSALPHFWTDIPALGDYLRFDVWYVLIVFLFVAPRLRR